MTELYCSTTINYAHPEFDVAPRSVDIHNARGIDWLHWEENGFELIDHVSAVADWADEDSLEQTYHAEMEALARSLTECDHALIGSHICRNPETARQHQDYAPIQYAHSDFTETYGDLLRHRFGSSDPGAERALERAGIDARVVESAERLLVLQFWRNVGAPKMDLPLAFCDAQTVPRSELLSINVPNYADSGEPFDAFGLLSSDEQEHQWYVFPEMRSDEVIAFRTYDSACVDLDQPFWTPHCAFPDPHHAPGSGLPARYSIEVRATCLFT